MLELEIVNYCQSERVVCAYPAASQRESGGSVRFTGRMEGTAGCPKRTLSCCNVQQRDAIVWQAYISRTRACSHSPHAWARKVSPQTQASIATRAANEKSPLHEPQTATRQPGLCPCITPQKIKPQKAGIQKGGLGSGAHFHMQWCHSMHGS